MSSNVKDKRFKIHLDAKDVLSQLGQIGYSNISPEQLKEFMKDLKKLIKHDLKKKFHDTNHVDSSKSSLYTNSIESSDVLTASSVTTSHKMRMPLNQIDSGNSCVSTSQSSCSEASMAKEDLTDGNKKSKKAKGHKKTLPEPPRHDPVALYHYYNKFWKQFNIPDENKQLNWEVSEPTKRSAGDRLCF